MSLTDLLLVLKDNEGETSKHVDIMFDPCGVMVMADRDEEMTGHEIHYALAVAYIHAGAELKGIILKPNDVAFLGHRLYSAFHNSYKGIQTINEMSLEDFNEYMLDHGL